MSGEGYTITEVRHDWTDLGIKRWTVFFTKADGSQWCMSVLGSDELAAYVEAVRKLDGAS